MVKSDEPPLLRIYGSSSQIYSNFISEVERKNTIGIRYDEETYCPRVYDPRHDAEEDEDDE
jgi:hypothetical protein